MSLLLVTRIFSPAFWGWVADHTGKRAEVVQFAAVLGLITFAVFLRVSLLVGCFCLCC